MSGRSGEGGRFGLIPPAEILLCAKWVERQDLGERNVGFSNEASANSLYKLKIIF